MFQILKTTHLNSSVQGFPAPEPCAFFTHEQKMHTVLNVCVPCLPCFQEAYLTVVRCNNNSLVPAAALNQLSPSSQTTAAPSAHQRWGWPGWKGETLDPDRWDTGILLEPCGAAAERPSY